MTRLILYTALTALFATTASVHAKDKHKDQDRDRDDHRRESSERDHRGSDYRRDSDRYRGPVQHRQSDRTRTIYIIERDRPVQRVVYIDSDGRYYQRVNGHRVYVRQRYFESYPSRYYTSSGQRRISIRLPF